MCTEIYIDELKDDRRRLEGMIKWQLSVVKVGPRWLALLPDVDMEKSGKWRCGYTPREAIDMAIDNLEGEATE